MRHLPGSDRGQHVEVGVPRDVHNLLQWSLQHRVQLARHHIPHEDASISLALRTQSGGCPSEAMLNQLLESYQGCARDRIL